MGQLHFDELVPDAGPYTLNRAASAYERAIAAAATSGSSASAELRAQAHYKLAWTYYKQQRFSAATAELISVLRMKAGADFDKEASTYVAGSLTEVDFVGPAASEPFIARADVLDTEHDPAKAEAKLAIGLDRVQDPKIVTQDQPFTAGVHSALALEYRELSQHRNAIRVDALYLARWPLETEALSTRFATASSWETLSSQKPVDKAALKSAIAGFAEVEKQGSPGGAWFTARAADPRALEAAKMLVATATTRRARLRPPP